MDFFFLRIALIAPTMPVVLIAINDLTIATSICFYNPDVYKIAMTWR